MGQVTVWGHCVSLLATLPMLRGHQGHQRGWGGGGVEDSEEGKGGEGLQKIRRVDFFDVGPMERVCTKPPPAFGGMNGRVCVVPRRAMCMSTRHHLLGPWPDRGSDGHPPHTHTSARLR